MPQNDDHMINLRRGLRSRETSDDASEQFAAPRTRFGGSASRLNRTVVIIALLGVAIGGIALQGAFRTPWRAVFLTNNQVYFGKFRDIPFAPSITLREVYYLQVNQPIQPNEGAAAAPAVAVIKLGSEVHGPEDAMVIPKGNILYWENLKADSAVARTIEEYKRRNP